MNSALYRCKVMHNRLAPKKHSFHYNVFMFYIDLDEIRSLSTSLFLFSHNRFNFFSFLDNEHLQLPPENPDKSKGTKQQILDYLKANGVQENISRIMLLTNLNVLGYNFNPVSFYFCFNEHQPVCCVAEVSNTFREMKPYLLKPETLNGDTFELNTTKYFYVSPFIDHDTNFDFRLSIPSKKLQLRIDDYKNGERFFISTLTGSERKLSNPALAWYSVRFPFITLRIISLIHWQALKLWFKKLKYHKKSENKDLQREVYRKFKDKDSTELPPQASK